ncbi:MAG: SUMF1/EgtB/PvdO family nonheme iron enzyme [bacterium]
MRRFILVTAAITLLGLGTLAQAITIETVAIGNARNSADTQVMYDGTTGYGSVGYDYNIGKYEVTAGQYTAFLNAKANVSDAYGLYNDGMWSDTRGCQIQRSSISGGYSYNVASDYANRPVNFVSFWDSVRFANWLNNGQGNSSTETGAYTLNSYNGTDGRVIGRNAGATWTVTSEDEWYKAAYYKGGNTNAGYWLYPTKSNTAPGNNMADPSGNNANYYTGIGSYPIDSGKYTTVVGEFQNSASAYGTFDQGGNVFEWNEAIPYIGGGYAYRGLRGGSFNYYYFDGLRSADRNYNYPAYEFSNIGFRVSQVVPEPSSIIALLGGLGSLLAFRRQRA